MNKFHDFFLIFNFQDEENEDEAEECCDALIWDAKNQPKKVRESCPKNIELVYSGIVTDRVPET